MLSLFRPRLFLSYSRTDQRLANSLRAALTKRGFVVFQDSAEILAGEDFVDRIVAALRRSDAVISLQTEASAASEWCRAELYHAYALGVPVVPVRFSDEVKLSRPLELLQERVHQLTVTDGSDLPELSTTLERQLRRARARRWRRAAAFIILGLLFAGGLLVAVVALERRIDSRELQRQREVAIGQLTDVDDVMAQTSIDQLTTRFGDDRAFLEDLLVLREDTTRRDATRMNSWLISNALQEPRRTEGRWVLRDLNFRSLRIEGAEWTNMTLLGESLQDVVFRRTVFAGVVWGEGLTIAGLRCTECDFWFTWFAGAVGVDLEFVNTSFRGSEIDLTRLSLFRLLSRESRPELQTLITDEISVVENSVILNRNSPPPRHVLDLSVPTEEALFEGVVFRNVHFRGYIRPEWFQECHFLHCVLPTSLLESELEAGGNVLDMPVWSDEPLD